MVKPLHNYVHIKPDERDEQTKSGIYLVQEMGSYPNTGTVLDYGTNMFGFLSEGDKVIYSQYAGVELEDKTLLLPADNVYAILEKQDGSSTT